MILLPVFVFRARIEHVRASRAANGVSVRVHLEKVRSLRRSLLLLLIELHRGRFRINVCLANTESLRQRVNAVLRVEMEPHLTRGIR